MVFTGGEYGVGGEVVHVGGTAVPEPSAAAGLALLAMGAAGVRRRKKIAKLNGQMRRWKVFITGTRQPTLSPNEPASMSSPMRQTVCRHALVPRTRRFRG